MKIGKDEINVAIELMGQYQEIKPLITQCLGIMSDALSQAKPMIHAFTDFQIAESTRAFTEYTKRGFSREEAMLLMLNSRVALKEALSNSKNTRGGK